MLDTAQPAVAVLAAEPPTELTGELSRDFKDMWNRWHITLSLWLRDHVYMRFLLKAGKAKWFCGNRQVASYAGQMLTMTLSGHLFW